MKTREFKVLLWNFNSKDIEYYDVIPYFIEAFKEKFNTAKKREEILKNAVEVKNFIKNESLYQFYSRCQYEIMVTGFPNNGKAVKIDAYNQILANLNLITEIFIDCFKDK